MPTGESRAEELGQRCVVIKKPSAIALAYQGDNIDEVNRSFFIRVRKLLIFYDLLEADYVRRSG